MNLKNHWPKLGCGVGLRATHYPVITSEWPKVDWFEAISENYMDSGGRPMAILEQIRAHYPVGLHGVALSIGSTDPLNEKYLLRLKNLADRIQPAIVSDHLCWSGAGGAQLHDLLPIPFTEESVRHVVSRVSQVQDYLKRQILLENVSTYVTFKHSTMPEWDFLAEVSKRSGCGILLDLNNIYVNSKNHGFDPYEYLDAIPGENIGQFHMAGHTDMGTYLFDTHSKPIITPVWDLYRDALRRWGQITTLVEWDEDIPEWDKLMEECGRTKKIYDEYSNHHPEMKTPKAEPAISYYERPAAGKSLKEIQTWMTAWVQPTHEKPSTDFVTGGERLKVYSGGYVARVHEGLKEVYETVHHLLEEETFVELTERYAERHPSHTYNLSLVGEHLPALLHEAPLKKRPYLEDLARLEWTLAESFHAFDEPPFDQAQLAKIPLEDWENARLIFQSSAHLLVCEWPVLELWKNRRQLEEAPKVAKKKEYLLIGRRGIQVRCEILDLKQYQLLESLFAGKTLGEACEALADSSATEEEEDIPIAAWFARWVQDGLIARCEIAGKSLPSS